jgi:hypothetical protein
MSCCGGGVVELDAGVLWVRDCFVGCLVLLSLVADFTGVRLSPRGDLICCGVIVPVVARLLVDVLTTGDDVEMLDIVPLVLACLDLDLSVGTGIACRCGYLGGLGGGPGGGLLWSVDIGVTSLVESVGAVDRLSLLSVIVASSSSIGTGTAGSSCGGGM